MALWGHPFANWGTLEGDGNAATLDRRIDGIVAGIDAAPIQGLTLGVAGGYTSNHANERNSIVTSGRTYAGAYGGWHDGAIALRVGGEIGWGATHVVRDVTFPGFAETLNSRLKSQIAQSFAEVAYDIASGPVSLEPFAGFAYTNARFGAFSETGGAAALHGASSNVNQEYSTVGLRLAYSAPQPQELAITPHALFAWEHAFAARRPDDFLEFEDTGQGFTTLGLPIDRDAANLEFGFDFALAPDRILSVYYEGLIGARTRDTTLRANFTWNF